MDLQFYQPENALLKPYIEGYYFFNNQVVGEEKEYLTYPNNYSIVSVNLNSKINLRTDQIVIEPSYDNKVYTSFAYHYSNPIKVYYTGPFQEITIYFKPLGINYFVDNLESMFSLKKITEFIPEFSDFKVGMGEIFTLDKRSFQIHALENYWLSKLKAKDLKFMHAILLDIESNMKIQDICCKYSISRKHLNYILHKNLGKSAVEYRKIYRFRQAISKHQDFSLTALSYDNFFFDQAHFNRDFKSFTEINPHRFFEKVNTSNKNVWLFS